MKAKPDESPEAYVLRLRLRIDALEAALRDVCEAAVVDYGDSPNGWYVICLLCEGHCDYDTGALHHAPDCPVAAALALLEAA
jgi:hypothetical protein